MGLIALAGMFMISRCEILLVTAIDRAIFHHVVGKDNQISQEAKRDVNNPKYQIPSNKISVLGI